MPLRAQHGQWCRNPGNAVRCLDHMAILTPDERVGAVLADRYEIQAVLAQGGMGVLFSARHVVTGRVFAVKLLKPRDLAGGVDSERFLLEVRATSALRHPNVVDIFDTGKTDDGAPFMVMELLAGRPLSDELADAGAVAPEVALEYVLPLMGALAVLHDNGFVHRDIKPSNVFLSRDLSGNLVPKLLDFGVAKAVTGDTNLTASGLLIGTPAYMSPEQVRADRVGPPSDVWATGALLFRCLSGRLPFEGESMVTLVKIASETPPRLCSVARNVTPALGAAIDRALMRNLELRYSDMRQFARALLGAALSDGIRIPTAPDPMGLSQWATWLEHDRLATMPGTPSPMVSRGSTDATISAVAARRRVPWLTTALGVVGASALLLAVTFVRSKPRQEPELASEPASSRNALVEAKPVVSTMAVFPESNGTQQTLDQADAAVEVVREARVGSSARPTPPRSPPRSVASSAGRDKQPSEATPSVPKPSFLEIEPKWK